MQSNTYNTGAKKNDEDKLRYDLIPPEVLQEVAKVFSFGKEIYGKDNWKKGLEQERLYSATMRHLEADRMGEKLDKESKLPHLAHAVANIMISLWFDIKKGQNEKQG